MNFERLYDDAVAMSLASTSVGVAPVPPVPNIAYEA
jgi:hypothetical protein